MAVPVIEHHTTALKGDSSASSISVSHTGTGSDLLAVVCLSHRYGADAITGVTYGGNAMTRAIGSAVLQGAYIYYLVSAPSGAQTVEATWNNGLTNPAAITAMTITGADLSDPIDETGNAWANSSTPSVSVTTTVNDCLIIDCLTVRRVGVPSITGGQTLIYANEQATASSFGRSYEEKATAGAETLSWSLAGAEEWQHVAAAINADGGGGGGSTAFSQAVVII